MELHGPKLLGASYKDPISSFSLFQKFSIQNPEVWIQFCTWGFSMEIVYILVITVLCFDGYRFTGQLFFKSFLLLFKKHRGVF